MLVGTPIYIGYIVISIVLFMSMIAIELFRLHDFFCLLDFSLSNYISLYL